MKRKSITDFFSSPPKKTTKQLSEEPTLVQSPIIISDDSDDDECMVSLPRQSSREKIPFKYVLNQKETGVQVRYIHRFLSHKESKELLNVLMERCKWTSPQFSMYGKDIVSKRKVAFFGPPEKQQPQSSDDTIDHSVGTRRYSSLRPQTDWPDELIKLKEKVESIVGKTYECALINRYDDGDDLIGWHADREATGFSIASVSLGATRDFQLRPMPKEDKETTQQSPLEKKSEIITKPLENGSLLVMNGATQKYYQHCVPKRKGIMSARINITFRDMV